MKAKRLLSLLLVLCMLLSVFPMAVSATEGSEDKRPTRARLSYTHYTDEELMDMLHLSKTKFKTFKESLRDAILNNTSCKVSTLKIPYDEDAKTAIRGMVYYHPDYFFVASISYATVKVDGNKVISRISFKYEGSYEEGIRKFNELEKAAEEILCPIRGAGLSQLEQALLVHDFLAVNSEYDRKAASGEDRYTAYGSIVNRMSVCQGYTEGYAYLLGKLGIPVNLCKSDELNHAWNIVELDGKAYNVDCTWDDPTIDHAGYTRHVNFLRSTDGMIEEGHVAEDFTATTTDTDYDDAFWQKSTAKFCLLGDTIYYLSGGKIYSWKDGKSTQLYKLTSNWKPYVNRFDYLACDGENLFFSSPEAIYRFDPETRKAAVFYKPDLSANKNFKIYGFAIRENKFYLDVYNTPNFDENTRANYQIVYTYRKDVASTHRFDEGKVLDPVTCTDDGETLFTCLGCGFTKTETVTAPGHSVLTDKALTPTCTQEGLTEGQHCSACNKILTKQEVLPPTGHSYVNNVCKVCGDQPKTTPSANGFRSGDSGKFVLAAKVGTTYYALSNTLPTKASKPKAVEIPVKGGTVSSSNAQGFALTLTLTDKGYTIENNGTYLKYSSSTNVGTDSKPYYWNLVPGINGSWRLIPTTASTRALLFRGKTYNLFGAYTASNSSADSTEYYDLEILPIGSGTSCKHSTTVTETVAPTCETGGSTSVKCKSCGEILSATTLTATGHKKVTDKAVSATCTQSGLTRGYHCSVCKKVLTAQETVPATGHSFTNGKCSVCGTAEVLTAPFKTGASGTFVLAAKVGDTYYALPNSFPGSAAKLRGGELTVTNGVVRSSDAADYALTLKYSSGKYTISGEDGYLKYPSSTNLISSTTSYKWTITKGTNGSWRITSGTSTRGLVFRAGKYMQFGAYLVSNAKAGDTEYFDLEILPVEASEATCSHSHTSVAKRAPGCREEGSETVTCQDCGEVIHSTVTPSLGHDFSTVDVRNPGSAPTCTADGYQGYCCSRCAETTETVIAATGHRAVVDSAVAPTCTATGLTEGSHCEDCLTVIVEQEVLPMMAHSYTEGSCTLCGAEEEDICLHTNTEITETLASCTLHGSLRELCTDCGKLVRNETYATVEHTAVTDPAQAPTCTATGLTEGTHCSVCEEVLLPQEVIPTLHHYYADGFCTTCGGEEPEAIAFHYGASGEFVLAAKVGTEYYALPNDFSSQKLPGQLIPVTNGTVSANDAQDFAVTLTFNTDGYTIENKGLYLAYKTGTSLEETDIPYIWTLTEGTNGSWLFVPEASTRGLIFRTGEYRYFGCFASSNLVNQAEEYFALEVLPVGRTDLCLHEETVQNHIEPTCTEEGSYAVYCATCGLLLDTQVLPTVDHQEEALPGVAPTCTATGLTEGKYCPLCEGVLEAQKVIPALGHSYENGICTLCGATQPTTEPFAIGMSGTFVLAAKVGQTYYTFSNLFPEAPGKLSGVPVEVISGEVLPDSAAPYALTLRYNEGVYTIENQGTFLSYATTSTSNTQLAGVAEPYHWVITEGTNGSFRITAEVSNRGLIYRAGSYNVFGSYATSNVKPSGQEYFDLEILPLAKVSAPELDESVVISHNLNLAGDIAINFAVKSTLLEGYDSYYLECAIPKYEGSSLVGSTTVKVSPVLNGSYYYFTLTGVTAVQMNDQIEATLHMTRDGKHYISNTDRYSIATYAYAQLNKTTVPDRLKTLCAELLRYGAKAQIYKKYRTDSLVDTAMTEAHRAYLSDLEAVTFGNNNTVLDDLENPSVLWKGKALNLDSRVSLQFIVDVSQYAGDPEALTLHLTYVDYRGDVQQTVLTDPILYTAGKSWYSFSFSGLLAAELRCVVEAAVYEGNTRVSQTLRYSADTYGNSKSGDLLTLCRALVAYSDAALAYFAN